MAKKQISSADAQSVRLTPAQRALIPTVDDELFKIIRYPAVDELENDEEFPPSLNDSFAFETIVVDSVVKHDGQVLINGTIEWPMTPDKVQSELKRWYNSHDEVTRVCEELVKLQRDKIAKFKDNCNKIMAVLDDVTEKGNY